MPTMTEPETQILEGILIDAEADLGGGLVAVQARPALEIFTSQGVVPAILEATRTAAFLGHAPDTATDKGRKAIASQAFKVTKTKTYLDDLGKNEVARLKELPRLVDAARKELRDGLDALAEEIRRPLTTWETQQAQAKARIASITNLPGTLMQAKASSQQIAEAIQELEASPLDPAFFAEHLKAAESALSVTLSTLRQQLEDRKRWEAEQAELARLREEKAERDRKEREEQLRREGEERARKAVELQRAAPAPAPAPAPAAPAPRAQEPLPWQGEQVPAPSAQEASQAATPQPAAAAVLSEDMEHRRAINREALADLLRVLAGDQAAAEALLRAIVRGQIRHVAITY